MDLIDTHCHLDFPEFKDDLDAVLGRAASAGIVRMISPGTNLASSANSIKLAEKYPDIFAACGIHPHEADKTNKLTMPDLRKLALGGDKIVAIGEVGLDYYRRFSNEGNQKRVFSEALRLAKELELPVILHNRDADEDFLRILEELSPYPAGGVIHCFSGDQELLKKLLELGFHVSFTGNITFDKAGNPRDVIKHVPIERLLIETDSPYISPVPLRGRRNEPANVAYSLDVLAQIYNLTKHDIARITTHNANQLFHLGIDGKPVAAYPIRDSLYLNITNRCTNRCSFCTRQFSNYVMGHNLKLDAEPTREEIISAMGDISEYDEIVFCGYGEPMLRTNLIKEIASIAKEKGKKVRVVTNGQGNLINARHVAPEMKGLVDKVSVSLNAPDAGEYERLCRSYFGVRAYGSILEFIGDLRKEGIEVEVTCLNIVGEGGVQECRAIAEKLGAEFRLRHLDVVG